MPVNSYSSRYDTRRRNTSRRHEIVRSKVNEYYTMRIAGMRPDFDSVIKKVADEVGYAERTVKDILKCR
jgi:AraC-like DNA-binding protein